MEKLNENFENCSSFDTYTNFNKILSFEEAENLAKQNNRLVSEINATKLEINAQRNWDLFYKRNGTRFFKNRHWATREFSELLGNNSDEKLIILEAGSGVGNLVYPLMEENLNHFYYVCDFSKRAIECVLQNPSFDPLKIHAFQCDITTREIFNTIQKASLDIVTLVFVLSSIHPNNFEQVALNFNQLLKPGGLLLFRDYGLYDMAQLRFKPGHKIAENLNFYVRQDGTRSYYFSIDEVSHIFQKSGFEIVHNEYVHRRTINIKEGTDVPRTFIQGKFRKKI